MCYSTYQATTIEVELANLYEIFKDKNFVDASKTTKSTKILVPESFRLYGIIVT